MTQPDAKMTNDYGGVARFFHWSVAILVFGLLIVGFVMIGLGASDTKFQVYMLHKSFGLTVLALGCMRLIWRFISPPPPALPTHQAWEKILAKTIHIVFYISIIGMPLSGWLMTSAAAYPNHFFGVFEVPPIFGKNKDVFELMQGVHQLFAYGLIGAIALHVAGALKHHLLDRDETLRRMGAHPVIGFVALLVLAVPATMAMLDLYKDLTGAEDDVGAVVVTTEADLEFDEASAAQEWVIEPENSVIAFQFNQYGQNVEGHFGEWSGMINFDSDDLEHSRAVIRINPASIETGSDDRNAQAKERDWFAISQYPEITFKSLAFDHLEANRYHVVGNLTLRGITLPVSFPFTLDFVPQAAPDTALTDNGARQVVMIGVLKLNRLDFGIGQGQWQKTDAIAETVDVGLKISAHTPAARPSAPDSP